MRRISAIPLVATFVFATLTWAQAPPKMPQPGPEHKRLAYFLGTWSSEAETKASPYGPAGKVSFTEHNEWFPGGFFIVTHSEEKGPMGPGKGLAVMGYNTQEKAYTYYAVNSMGMTESAKGTVQGDTWTWQSESKVGGKPIKNRFTIKELSATSYSYKFETSPDGKTWSTIMEGKSTKKVSAPKAK